MILRLLSLLPLSILYLVARVFYWIVYYLVRYRRCVVRGNLTRAFPEKNLQQIFEVERNFYRHFCNLSAEIIHANRISVESLRARVQFNNLDMIREKFNEGQSIILLAAHQGNWEWLLLALCIECERPMDAVYKPLSRQSVDRFIGRVRRRFGSEPIAQKGAMRAMLKRRGRVSAFAFVADQSPKGSEEKYWTHFLCQDSAFHPGTEKLTRLLKYPVFYISMERRKTGYYEVNIEQIGAAPYCDNEFQVTERYARSLERVIVSDPASWLWSNRKWKHPKPPSPGSV